MNKNYFIKQLRRIFYVSVLILSYSAQAQTTVSSLSALQTAIDGASEGETIILSNNSYTASTDISISDINVNISNPIIIKAETIGGAIISGNGTFKIKNSSGIVVDGFKLTQQVEATSFKIESSHNIRVSNCIFDLVENGSKSYWLYVTGALSNGDATHHIRIDHNDFYEKHDEGCFIVVYGPDTDISQYVTIDHNHFQGHTFSGDNGGEAIRFGDSNRQNYDSYAVLESNLFENCNGDVEVISMKTSQAVVRRNTLQGCNGSIVLRHGDDCTIEGNFIMNGDGGIRFYGDNQKIIGNYIFNNDNKDNGGSTSTARGALVVGGGDKDDLNNGENTYDRPENCIVAYNTLAYNKGMNVDIGVFGDTYPPKSLTFSNNIIISNNDECVNFRMTPESSTFQTNILWGSASAGEIPSGGYSQTDPQVTIDGFEIYHIASSSPAKDAATTIGALSAYITDIDGQARSNKDVGCDEYATSTVNYRPLTSGDVGAGSESGTDINAYPQLSVSAPQMLDEFNQGATVSFSISAGDSDGEVVKAEFFANGSLIGTETTAPFSFDWTNASPGIYQLTVSVTDDEAAVTTSAEVIKILVKGTENKMTISGGNVTASSNDGNLPANTVDSDLGTRWSADGNGEWIAYDLGMSATIDYVKIAFHQGDTRTAFFAMEVSDDNATWTPVISTGSSCGCSLGLEFFDMQHTSAKYVRYMGGGNSSSTWNSVAEVEMWTGNTISSSSFISGNKQIAAFPNPTNGKLILEGLSDNSYDKIYMYDLFGREVLMISNLLKNEIDISHLNEGLYLIAFTKEGVVGSTIKVLKK